MSATHALSARQRGPGVTGHGRMQRGGRRAQRPPGLPGAAATAMGIAQTPIGASGGARGLPAGLRAPGCPVEAWAGWGSGRLRRRGAWEILRTHAFRLFMRRDEATRPCDGALFARRTRCRRSRQPAAPTPHAHCRGGGASCTKGAQTSFHMAGLSQRRPGDWCHPGSTRAGSKDCAAHGLRWLLLPAGCPIWRRRYARSTAPHAAHARWRRCIPAEQGGSSGSERAASPALARALLPVDPAADRLRQPPTAPQLPATGWDTTGPRGI